MYTPHVTSSVEYAHPSYMQHHSLSNFFVNTLMLTVGITEYNNTLWTTAIHIQSQASNSPKCVESIDNQVWKLTIYGHGVRRSRLIMEALEGKHSNGSSGDQS